MIKSIFNIKSRAKSKNIQGKIEENCGNLKSELVTLVERNVAQRLV
jgi:hypothetical protein